MARTVTMENPETGVPESWVIIDQESDGIVICARREDVEIEPVRAGIMKKLKAGARKIRVWPEEIEKDAAGNWFIKPRGRGRLKSGEAVPTVDSLREVMVRDPETRMLTRYEVIERDREDERVRISNGSLRSSFWISPRDVVQGVWRPPGASVGARSDALMQPIPPLPRNVETTTARQLLEQPSNIVRDFRGSGRILVGEAVRLVDGGDVRKAEPGERVIGVAMTPYVPGPGVDRIVRVLMAKDEPILNGGPVLIEDPSEEPAPEAEYTPEPDPVATLEPGQRRLRF